MLDARYSHLYFCQSLNRLQRGLSAIAELLLLQMLASSNIFLFLWHQRGPPVSRSTFPRSRHDVSITIPFYFSEKRTSSRWWHHRCCRRRSSSSSTTTTSSSCCCCSWRRMCCQCRSSCLRSCCCCCCTAKLHLQARTETIPIYATKRKKLKKKHLGARAKAGMVHSVSGWTRRVQVKLWDPLRTRAIPERLRGVFTTRRYTNPRLLYLTLPYHLIKVITNIN